MGWLKIALSAMTAGAISIVLGAGFLYIGDLSTGWSLIGIGAFLEAPPTVPTIISALVG